MSKIMSIICFMLLSAVSVSAQTSLKCDFTQTKHLKMMNEDMVSRGRMCFQQPDRLRWEYTEPYSGLFILNGTKISLKWSQGTKTLDSGGSRTFKEIARLIMNSISGKILSDDSFCSDVVDTSDGRVVTLVPQKKEMLQFCEKMVVHIGKAEETVNVVELYEKSGDYTIIKFSNVRKDVPVDPASFELE